MTSDLVGYISDWGDGDGGELPVFRAIYAYPSMVFFTCPKCGRRNGHGSEDGKRKSHCACWDYYYIFIVKRLPEEEAEALPQDGRECSEDATG